MSLCFFGRGYISRGESSSPKFGGGGGGGGGCCCLTDLDSFLEGGQVKRGEVNISIFQGGTDSLEKTMLSVPFSNYLLPFIYCPLKNVSLP